MGYESGARNTSVGGQMCIVTRLEAQQLLYFPLPRLLSRPPRLPSVPLLLRRVERSSFNVSSVRYVRRSSSI